MNKNEKRIGILWASITAVLAVIALTGFCAVCFADGEHLGNDIKTVIVDDTDPNIAYFGDGWVIQDWRNDRYGETLHSSPNAGAGFEYTAHDCTRIRIFGSRSRGSGSAYVIIDGVRTAFAETKQDSDEVTRTVWFDSGALSRGTHTVRAEYAGGWVELDYIEVQTDEKNSAVAFIDDADLRVSYSGDGWAVQNDRTDRYGNTLHSSMSAGVGYEFTADECTRIKLYGHRASFTGSFEVFIDGVFAAVVNTVYNGGGELTQTLLYDSGPLYRGTHSIKTVYRGDGWVEFDFAETVCDKNMPLAENIARRRMDDTDPAIEYGGSGWVIQNDRTDRYENTLHSSPDAGAGYQFTIDDCTRIALYGHRASFTGSFTVYLDDVKQGVIHTAYTGGGELTQTLIFDSGELLRGAHTVRTEYSGGFTELDFIDVYIDGTQDRYNTYDDGAIAFGAGWTAYTGLNTDVYINGNNKSSLNVGAEATAAFNCRRIMYYATFGRNRGGADVYLDGVFVKKISQKADAELTSQTYLMFDSGELSPGAHVLKFVTDGEGWFEIDKFIIKGVDADNMLIDDGNGNFVLYTGETKEYKNEQAIGGTYRAVPAGSKIRIVFFGSVLKGIAFDGNDAEIAVTVDGEAVDTVADNGFFLNISGLDDRLHEAVINVNSGTLKADCFYVGDENLRSIKSEMQKATQKELDLKKAGAWQASDPAEWKPVKIQAETPTGGVKLGDGLFNTAFTDNIEYIKRCYSRENYVDATEWWVEGLTGSNYGRMLAAAGNTLRWVTDSQLDAIVDDILGIIESFETEDGFIMPYDEKYMKYDGKDWRTSERPAYDCAMLARGLIAAGNVKRFRGVPDADNKAYRLLRSLYTWWETDSSAEKYGNDILKESLGIQGMPGFTSAYFTPVGREQDIIRAEQYFVMNWWLEYLAAGIPESINSYPLDRPHANLCTAILGLFDIYLATGQEKYLDACKGYYDIMTKYYMMHGGSVAICEFDVYDPASYWIDLAHHTGETCSSVFFAELCQKFLSVYPTEEKYAGIIEKLLYNVCTASQRGRIGFRYHNRLNGIAEQPAAVNTCCEVANTALIARLREFIYSYSEKAVYVNLFEPSAFTANVNGGEFRITQTGSLYRGDAADMVVEKANGAELYIRVPEYADNGMTDIYVNGVPHRAVAGTYFRIIANDGDRITFDVTDKLTAHRYTGSNRVDGFDRYCFMRGNVLYGVRITAESGHEYRFDIHGQGAVGLEEYALAVNMTKDAFMRGLTVSSDGYAYKENGNTVFELVPYNTLNDTEHICVYPLFDTDERPHGTTVTDTPVKSVFGFDGDDGACDFELFASGTGNFGLSDGKLISADDGEQKAILKDITFVGEMNVGVTVGSRKPGEKIDGGIYINVGEAANATDAVSAYCVNLEKAANSDKLFVKIHKFDFNGGEGKYCGAVSSVCAPYEGGDIRLKCVVSDGVLYVRAQNGGNSIALDYLLPYELNGKAGLRGFYSETAFSDFTVYMSKDEFTAKTEKDKSDALAVDEMIAALPDTDEIAVEDKKRVSDVLASYAALNDDAKSYVVGYGKLTALKEKIEITETAQKAAKAVTDLIAALPETQFLTLADKEKTENARSAYDALDTEAKKYVLGYEKLVSAEERIARLENGDKPTIKPTDGKNEKTNTGAIAGGVIGGVAGAALIAAVTVISLKRNKRRKRENDN